MSSIKHPDMQLLEDPEKAHRSPFGGSQLTNAFATSYYVDVFVRDHMDQRQRMFFPRFPLQDPAGLGDEQGEESRSTILFIKPSARYQASSFAN